jgi:DNA-binding MarR family transcriptional regulator
LSNNERAALVAAVGEAVRAFQEATDAFDEAAAAKLGINRTDLRCLGTLANGNRLPVGEVGRLVGLTRGAATIALDRCERAGYVERSRDPSDRRGVYVAMSRKGVAATDAIWNPMVADGYRRLAAFSDDELRVVRRFLEESRAVQLDHLG